MFINNIKLHYYDKLIKQSIEKNDLHNLRNSLENSEKDKKLLLKLLKSNLFKISETQEFKSIFPQNILWVNSYENEDVLIVNKFLDYYLAKIKFSYSAPKHYSKSLFEIFDDLGIEGDISYEEITNFSYVYQYLISISARDKLIILNSNAAFFESKIGRLFTHFFLTKAFFYIVRDPLYLYKKYKTDDKNLDNHAVLNKLLNLENGISKVYNDHRFYEENKQGWHINVKSWNNINAINTFRGLLFKIEDILDKPDEAFAEMIGHLIQSGVRLNLDYSIIRDFINEHREMLTITKHEYELSKNEKKLLNREIGDLAKSLKYNIEP